MLDPIINATDMHLTEPMKKRINEILSKSEHFLKDSTRVEVVYKREGFHEGKERDLCIEITVHMPKAIIRVEERGEDFYSILDLADNILKRKLKRYNDKKLMWNKKVSWKVVETNSLLEDDGEKILDITNPDYTPLIIKKKEYSDNTPISIGEAIEKMELIGHNAFMFRNVESGKYTMIYKRDDGHYGLVEPKYTE